MIRRVKSVCDDTQTLHAVTQSPNNLVIAKQLHYSRPRLLSFVKF